MKRKLDQAQTAGKKIKGSGLIIQMPEELRNVQNDILLRNLFLNAGIVKRNTAINSSGEIFTLPTMATVSDMFYLQNADLLVETAETLWTMLKVRAVSGAGSLTWFPGLVFDSLAKLDLSGLANGTYSIFAEHTVNYYYPFPATFVAGTADVTFVGGDLTKVFEAGMSIMFGGTAYEILSVNSGANKLVLTAVHGLTDGSVFVEIGADFSPATPPASWTEYRFLEMDGLTITSEAGSTSPSGRKIKLCQITKSGAGSYSIATTGRTYAKMNMGELVGYIDQYLSTRDLNVNGNKVINLANGSSAQDGVTKSQLDTKLNKNIAGETSTDPRAGTGSTPGAALTVDRTGVSGTPPDIFLDVHDHGVSKAQIRYDGKMVVQPGASGNDAVNYSQLAGKVALAGAETIPGVKKMVNGLKIGDSDTLLDSVAFTNNYQPTVEGAGGTPGVTYSYQYGRYMIIGKLVIYVFYVEWSATTYAGGTLFHVSTPTPIDMITSNVVRLTKLDNTYHLRETLMGSAGDYLSIKVPNTGIGEDMTLYKAVTGSIVYFQP